MPQPEFLKKPMNEFTREEWESLCDGCGLCCQMKFQDEDTDEIVTSSIACDYLCLKSHSCTDYKNRTTNQPLCDEITPENIATLTWMPFTCSYRLVHEGQELPSWHYLVCGDKQRVHTDGPSMKGMLIHEKDADEEDFEY